VLFVLSADERSTTRLLQFIRQRREMLVDDGGEALERLGVNGAAQYLVRPDGHIGYRCAGSDLSGVSAYLARWFPGTDAA
jgi:hypothetical protein